MSPPQITLYGAFGSCSVAPEAILRHLSVPFEYKAMTIAPGGGIKSVDDTIQPEEYKHIHPGELVPALRVGGEIITENVAIMTMAALLGEKPEILGRDTLGKTRVAEWMAWLSGKVHGQGFGGLWRPLRYSDEESHFEKIQEKARKTVDHNYERIEITLKEKRARDGSDDKFFAVGHDLTVVDFYLYVFATWGVRIGVDMAGLYPNYMALVRKLEQLDAIKTTVKFNEKDLVTS